jgi:hypothetical protein
VRRVVRIAARKAEALIEKQRFPRFQHLQIIVNQRDPELLRFERAAAS